MGYNANKSIHFIDGYIISVVSMNIFTLFMGVPAALILSTLILGFLTVFVEIYTQIKIPDTYFESFYMILGGVIPMLLILMLEISNAVGW